MPVYGELEQTEDGRWRLRFERTLAHPPEKVWRALTAPEHLAHWFPTTIDGERASGARLRFVFPKDHAPPFEGEMLAYEPPTLMELRWGPDTLRFELQPSADGTVLTLLDTLEEVGKAARDGAGWHVCLDGLALHLDGKPNARDSMDSWTDVHPTYVADFGATAATIGPPEALG
jgi:uncharacterized protein YndB with AHSA1/START domain